VRLSHLINITYIHRYIYTARIYLCSSRRLICPDYAHSWFLPRLSCVNSRRVMFQFRHIAHCPVRCCQFLDRTRSPAYIRCVCIANCDYRNIIIVIIIIYLFNTHHWHQATQTMHVQYKKNTNAHTKNTTKIDDNRL